MAKQQRIWIGAAILATMPACSQEADFDARYEKASAEIAERVEALDAEDARIRAEMGLISSTDQHGAQMKAKAGAETGTAAGATEDVKAAGAAN